MTNHIVITEKTKNLKTGEKTRKKTKTVFMADWLVALYEWTEKHCEEDSIVNTAYWKNKKKIGFTTVRDDIRYKLSVEWKF